jgi:hypothetical protein
MPPLELDKYSSLLYSEFATKPKQRSEPRRSGAKKAKAVGFCSSQRAQVILLAMFQLRSFDNRPEDLARALTSMDAHALTQSPGADDDDDDDDEVQEALGTALQSSTSPSSQ